MAERLVGGDHVAQPALEFGDFRKAAFFRARPEDLALDTDDVDAAGARHERCSAELIFECLEQLLRHPGGAQHPAALPAILDLDPWKSCRHHGVSNLRWILFSEQSYRGRLAGGGEDEVP